MTRHAVSGQADADPARKRTAEQLQEQLGKLDAYLAAVEAWARNWAGRKEGRSSLNA